MSQVRVLISLAKISLASSTFVRLSSQQSSDKSFFVSQKDYLKRKSIRINCAPESMTYFTLEDLHHYKRIITKVLNLYCQNIMVYMKVQILLKSYSIRELIKYINKTDMDPMMIKQVSLDDWNIKIEKKDLGILFTCIRKKPTYTLYLEIYHVPQNIIILFDTLEDLWTYLKYTDRYVMEGNTLKVAFMFGMRQKQISFHMEANQSELIDHIYRLEEENRAISLRFQEQIVQLREDNLRKDKVINELKHQIDLLQLQKRKYEETLNKKSIFNQYLTSIKAQSQPKSQLFASPSIEKDIFNVDKKEKIELPHHQNSEKNIFDFSREEECKKQMVQGDIIKKNQKEEISKIEEQLLAQKQRRRKRNQKKYIRIK